MLSAMARGLVERNGIGESADAVWRALNDEHQKLFPTTSGSNGDVPFTDVSMVLPGTQASPQASSKKHHRRLGTDPGNGQAPWAVESRAAKPSRQPHYSTSVDGPMRCAPRGRLTASSQLAVPGCPTLPGSSSAKPNSQSFSYWPMICSSALAVAFPLAEDFQAHYRPYFHGTAEPCRTAQDSPDPACVGKG
jgi:hypothetical protein